MAKRKRDVPVLFWVSAEELELIIKDAAIRDREFERLSAENGAGWLCGQAGTARAEGVGLLMRRSSNNLNQLTAKCMRPGGFIMLTWRIYPSGRNNCGRV